MPITAHTIGQLQIVLERDPAAIARGRRSAAGAPAYRVQVRLDTQVLAGREFVGTSAE
jgi:hypothetical protein